MSDFTFKSRLTVPFHGLPLFLFCCYKPFLGCFSTHRSLILPFPTFSLPTRSFSIDCPLYLILMKRKTSRSLAAPTRVNSPFDSTKMFSMLDVKPRYEKLCSQIPIVQSSAPRFFLSLLWLSIRLGVVPLHFQRYLRTVHLSLLFQSLLCVVPEVEEIVLKSYVLDVGVQLSSI